MTVNARKFTATSDQIAITPTAFLNGCQGFAIRFAFELDAGATTLVPNTQLVIASQDSNVNPNRAFTVYYLSDSSGANTIQAFVGDGSGIAIYATSFDPFAGFAGDGLRHYFTLEFNLADDSYNSSSRLSIDTTQYTSSQWQRTFSNAHFFPGGLAASTSPLLFGYTPIEGDAIVGMTFGELDIRCFGPTVGMSPGTTFFNYAGTNNDIALFAAGFPAQIIAPLSGGETGDVLTITGASPELGVGSVLTGTVTGTSVVTWPAYGNAYTASASLTHSSTAHTPGSIGLTLTGWTGGTPGSSVIFTATSSVGTVGGTITLGTSSSVTGSTTITVPGSLTNGTVGTVTITNNGGVLPIQKTFTVLAPAATLIADTDPLGGPAYGMCPTGNLAYVYFSDISGNPTPVTGVDLTGATVVKNGGSPIDISGLQALYDGVGSAGDNYLALFLGEPQQIVIIDDLDGGCTLGGSGATWTTGDITATAPYQSFVTNATSVDGVGSVSYSTNSGATAVYSFTGLSAGSSYILSMNSPGWYFVNGTAAPGGTPTTHAQFAIAGAGSVGPVAVDLTAAGSFDRNDLLYRWTDLATLAPTGTTLTVTLSNQAGSGTLYADALRVELVPVPFMQPGDTVVLNLPDSEVTTHAGTAGPLSLTLALQTDATWFPFDPTLPRNMKLGYNLGAMAFDAPPHMLANRAKISQGWFNAAGYDATGNLASASATSGNFAYIQSLSECEDFNRVTQGGVGNGLDFWGVPTDGPGTWKFNFATPGNPTVTLGNEGTANTTIGSAYTAGPTAGTWFSQSVGYTPWPSYTHSLELRCYSNGSANDYINQLIVFDPNTSTSWTKTTHPITYNRLAGNFPGGYLRPNPTGNVIGSNIVNWSDQHAATDLSYVGNSLNITAAITHVYPVTQSGYSAALATAQACLENGNGYGAVLVIAPSHGLTTGQTINLNNFTSTSNFPDTGDAGTPVSNFIGDAMVIAVGSDASGVPNDGNTLLVVTQTNATHSYAAANLVTIQSPLTLNGTEYLSCIAGQNAPPPLDWINVCNEVGMNLYWMVPQLVNDAYCNTLGQLASANMASGRKFAVNLSNELWNAGQTEWHRQHLFSAYDNQQYSISGGARGLSLQSDDEWNVWRSQQVHNQVIAGYTGVPEVRVSGYGWGATGTATVVVGSVTGITLNNGGAGYIAAPTVTILGGGGSGATATAAISDVTVVAIAVTAGGTSYTSTPTVALSGGGGSGATGTATIAAGKVTGIAVTAGGTSYTSTPTVALSGGGGSGATAAATISGSVTGLTLTAGGSGYTLTARPSTDIVRLIASGQNQTDVTVNIAHACNKWNVIFDALPIGDYQGNDPNQGTNTDGFGDRNYSGAIGSGADRVFDAMGPSDTLDHYGLVLRSSRAGTTLGHLSALESLGIVTTLTDPNGVQLWGYEVGLDTTVAYGTNEFRQNQRAIEITLDPRWYHFALAWTQQQEHTYKYSSVCYFTLDGSNIMYAGAQWYQCVCDTNGIGTGTAGENASRYLTTLVIQGLGAYRYYATAPTPTPTPTSTPVNCVNTIAISDLIVEVVNIGAIHAPAEANPSVIYAFAGGDSAAGTVAYVTDLHWELSGKNAVTLAASASVTYTLSALTDTDNRSIAFARVHKLLIWLTSRADGDYLIVGDAATHPWTAICSSGTATIPVFDALAVVAANKVGLVVSSGSSDQIRIHNAGSGPITFGINLSGCST